ncbi:MAG: hypothetical protein WCG80_11435 [Spirochaetales bacterium]
MRTKLLALLLTFSCAASGWSQDFDTNTLTVRQVWDNVTTLYATGHTFTPDEFGRLKAFQKSLLDAGETDLAARLDLLMLAAARENAEADADARLERGGQAWLTVQAAEKRHQEAIAWEAVRNIGLGGFALSTAGTLAVAAVWQRSPSLPADTVTALKWTFWSSFATLVMTLVPLVTGEINR